MKPFKNLHLERYTWKNRLVLLFAPTPDSDAATRQQATLDGEEAALRERDVVRFAFFTDGESFAIAHPAGQKVTVAPDVAAEAREQYGVGEEEFALILIGKDGNEHHRASQPIAASEILAAIDTMPMRQEEIRQEGGTP